MNENYTNILCVREYLGQFNIKLYDDKLVLI